MTNNSALRVAGLLEKAFPVSMREKGIAFFAKLVEENSTPEEREDFLRRFEQCGENWGHNEGHPLAARMIFALADFLLGDKGELQGLENCKRAMELAGEGKPVVMISNHMAYGDVNILQVLMERNGIHGFPFLVMAGTKVYSENFRRLSSMAFDTLKVAQPPSKASEGAEVPMRELARITRQVLHEAGELQAKGKVLFFFPEASRTRSGAMERFMPAAMRYITNESYIVPVGLSGTEQLLGVGEGEICADEICIRVGEPVLAAKLLPPENTESEGDRRKLLADLCGFLVADLLPGHLHGAYQADEKKGDADLSKACQQYYAFSNR